MSNSSNSYFDIQFQVAQEETKIVKSYDQEKLHLQATTTY